MDVPIGELLGISALGMIVVFAVLAFLMAVIYLMPLIMKAYGKKSAAGGLKVERETRKPDAPASPRAESLPAAADSDSDAARPVAEHIDDGLRKYRILFKGVEYDVDSAPVYSAPEVPSVSADQDPEPETLSVGHAQNDDGLKKYIILLDGIEYKVESEKAS